MQRRRLQIDLGPMEMLALERIRGLGESDAEVGRRAITLLARLAAGIQDGFTLALVSASEERFPDAAMELTEAVAPERHYHHLVKRPHPWRRQLALKGRRITVGQLVSAMRVDDMSPDDAAREYSLPREAIFEALDYAMHHEVLLEEEAAEERRRTEPYLRAPAG